MNSSIPPIEQASESIQLAVDLIYLLETNEIDPETALEALHIVEKDLQQKLSSKRQ